MGLAVRARLVVVAQLPGVPGAGLPLVVPPEVALLLVVLLPGLLPGLLPVPWE